MRTTKIPSSWTMANTRDQLVKYLILFSLLGGESNQSSLFHVMSKCSVPIIIGLSFVHKIQLYTMNTHLLVDFPFTFGNISSFKWIGSPKGKIQFFADGHKLEAGADTGSDIDLMSLRCAVKRGFKVDSKRKTRIMLADETIVGTIGQVDVSSVQLPGFASFNMSFHVLPNLVCDVIFGEEFLEQTDAFNTCKIIDDEDLSGRYSLNPLINLGPLQTFFAKMIHRKKNRDSSENAMVLAIQQHDKRMEAEIYRQTKKVRLMERLRGEGQDADAMMAEEERRRMAFQNLHTGCAHCIGTTVIPSGSRTSGNG